MDSAETAPGDLVQGAEYQPALGQAVIDRSNAERHDAALRPTALLDAGNPVAQLVENACRRGRHVPQNSEREQMFLFCSQKPGCVNANASTCPEIHRKRSSIAYSCLT